MQSSKKRAALRRDSAASDALPVPVSHKQLMQTRRAAYERGEMRTLTMEERKKLIRRRR
jgi:hypothetical protein